MINWFDFLMMFLACFALFCAGYRIGWSRGFEECRSMVEGELDKIKKTLDAAKKARDSADREV